MQIELSPTKELSFDSQFITDRTPSIEALHKSLRPAIYGGALHAMELQLLPLSKEKVVVQGLIYKRPPYRKGSILAGPFSFGHELVTELTEHPNLLLDLNGPFPPAATWISPFITESRESDLLVHQLMGGSLSNNEIPAYTGDLRAAQEAAKKLVGVDGEIEIFQQYGVNIALFAFVTVNGQKQRVKLATGQAHTQALAFCRAIYAMKTKQSRKNEYEHFPVSCS